MGSEMSATQPLRLVAGADHRAAHQPVPDWRLLDGPVAVPADPDAYEDLAEHVARLGPRPPATGHHGETLTGTLAAIELTGRGGGHFPAARKWRAVLAAGGGGTVVANAAEGEPASAKDAVLLRLRPHLVLDGLVSAGEALGATDLVVWLHDADPVGHRAVVRALQDRRHASVGDPAVRIVTAPDRYLSGESSAIVRRLAGGPALPEFRRVPAAVSGVGGRPTLVHNVETLARVGLAARAGALAYRPTGLFTVVAGGRRSVVEADPTEPLAQVLAAGEVRAGAGPQAVLVGGYGGTWLPWATVAALPARESALRQAGASLGAGVLGVLPTGTCGLAETARVLDFLAASSARQCGPCLFGLPAIAEVFAALAVGEARRRDLRRLDRYAGEVAGRGACHHPDGAVRLATSALHTFAADVAAHRRGRPCAGAGARPVLPVPGQA